MWLWAEFTNKIILFNCFIKYVMDGCVMEAKVSYRLDLDES